MVRFKLFGIPFQVAPYFWILSAVLGSNWAHGERGLTVLAIWVGCVFVSIVVHELGHALMARRFGISPVVVLHGIGGSTYMPAGRFTRPQAILVTLAGPAAGLGLWALTQFVVVGLLKNPDGVSYITAYAVVFLIFINKYWTLFNLLPILPLDGGQFVRNLVGPRYLFVVRMVGGTVAAVACVLCLVWGSRYGLAYTAIILGLLAVQNFRAPASSSP